MTKKELSQLYWLNIEIQEEKRKLEELKAVATNCTTKITGLPHVSSVYDKVGDLSVLLVEQKELIELKIKQSIIEYNRLKRYIADINDSQIRTILSLRYINGLSWQEIAYNIGGNNTSDSIRKKHDRFLKLSVLSDEDVI